MIILLGLPVCGGALAQTPLTPEQELLRKFVTSRRDHADRQKPSDECTKLLERIRKKEVSVDNSSLRALTASVLKELNIPPSSQLLVYSGSASQGIKVNPRNPRALYFNDECYVGIVPNGLLEMIGVDALGGAQLYTFQNVGKKTPPTSIRNDGCIRCHGQEPSGYAPGFFIRSSHPEISGKMTSVTSRPAGHSWSLSSRFGGWFVTSTAGQNFALAGEVIVNGVAVPTKIGEHFEPTIHLAKSSDILAHLLHEHQLGFHNRLIRAVMSAQDNGVLSGQQVSSTHEADIEQVVGYMLFRSEAKLPRDGIVGDPQYMSDFRANRRLSRAGASLKDLDLKTRLMKYRCSYMIYTRPFLELPKEIKAEILTRLHKALQDVNDPLSKHLEEFERLQILHILRDTLPDRPDDW
jgi:hypothetical protein